MTVSQQISPSALRAYKLSKYANGQPQKMLLEAKRLRRVTSQFMSKSGAKEAAKKMKALKKTASTTKKIADNAKKIQDAFFKTMPGGANPKNAGIAGGQLLNIIIQGGLAAAVIQNTLIQNFINDRVDDQFTNQTNDLSKNLTLLTTLNSKFQNLNAKVEKFNDKITKELNANAKDFYQLNKATETIAKDTVAAKKQANDALYETREGRKILTGLAEAARKLANNALYEAREGRKIVEKNITEIRGLESKYNNFINSINTGFRSKIESTVMALQKSLENANQETRKANENISVQNKTISTVQVAIKDIQTGLASLPRTIDSKILEVKDYANKLVLNNIKPVENQINKIADQVQPTVTIKYIDGVTKSLRDTYNQTFEAQAVKWNEEAARQSDAFLALVKQGKATETIFKDRDNQSKSQLNAPP